MQETKVRQISKALDNLTRLNLSLQVPILQANNSVYINIDDFVSLSNEIYTEVAKGVFDRIVEHENDIKFDFEKDFIKDIKGLDFQKFHVILVKFTMDGFFGRHHHDTDEIIKVLKGSFRNDVTGKVYVKGETQYISSFEPHTFTPLESGVCLIQLIKKREIT